MDGTNPSTAREETRGVTGKPTAPAGAVIQAGIFDTTTAWPASTSRRRRGTGESAAVSRYRMATARENVHAARSCLAAAHTVPANPRLPVRGNGGTPRHFP